eukprot:Nitzschia sp. Nitz4//scaffold79_size90958//6264//7316//NITZ4_005007-RA/size90958-augustus-gene-0.166-mRNA-1//1//CDS//3329558195//6933//frame0
MIRFNMRLLVISLALIQCNAFVCSPLLGVKLSKRHFHEGLEAKSAWVGDDEVPIPEVVEYVPPMEKVFDPPPDTAPPSTMRSLSIQYSTGMRWMSKSFWIAQELLNTFQNELTSITMIPTSQPDTFVVRINNEMDTPLWNATETRDLPSPKDLKRILRDRVLPDKFLGHSDTKERQGAEALKQNSTLLETTPEAVPVHPTEDASQSNVSKVTKESPDTLLMHAACLGAPEPTVTIHYCTGCNWLLRAAYLGQEIFTEFTGKINSVTLAPSVGGRFTIELNNEIIFDRATEGRFPDVLEVYSLIRAKLGIKKKWGWLELELFGSH